MGRELLFVGSDPTDNTITLQLGIDRDRAIRVDLDLGVVGPLMAALSADALKLNAGIPEEERTSVSLQATAAWLSQGVDGDPMLVLVLANGSLLPLALKAATSPAWRRRWPC